jgi:hypothetical protein
MQKAPTQHFSPVRAFLPDFWLTRQKTSLRPSA